jgi:hypothetical protein
MPRASAYFYPKRKYSMKKNSFFQPFFIPEKKISEALK